MGTCAPWRITGLPVVPMLASKSRRAPYSVVKVRGAIPGCHRCAYRQSAPVAPAPLVSGF